MNPERFARLRSALTRRQPDLTVLMDRVSKSHNFSAILRNCDAVGVLEAHVVPPLWGLDLYHGSSGGTKKWISVHRHPDAPTAIGHLKGEGFSVLAAHPASDSVDFRDVDYTTPTALVMGAERFGVSDECLELADQRVKIPLAGMVHSLNVSVATSLLLFEAMRQREAAGMYEESRLAEADFERRLFEWAYPTLASARRRTGRPYLRLDEEGEIIRD
jgi:tRNA (guanosine-2'-O-)-methyltransferase